MRVDSRPDVGVDAVAELFGALGVLDQVLVGQCRQSLIRPQLEANTQGLLVHAHQELEDFDVLGQIGGRRQEAAQYASLVEDQRLAALPV